MSPIIKRKTENRNRPHIKKILDSVDKDFKKNYHKHVKEFIGKDR